MKIIIQGELMDLNTFINKQRSNKFGGAKAKKQETEKCTWFFKDKKIKDFPIHISFNWYCKDKRKDLDNISFAKKFIQDGMVEAGTIPNDGWSEIASFEDNFFIDKHNPRVEVLISAK